MDIRDITALAGGVVALSKTLGLSRGAVSQWAVVPAERVIAVCEACGWRCSPHQCRPDLYPNAGDAMPRLIPCADIEDRRVQDQRTGDRRIPDLFQNASPEKDEKAA